MSINSDVARLKRFGSPESVQWEKIRQSVKNVIENILLPLLPSYSEHEQEELELPRGYRLVFNKELHNFWLQRWDKEHLVLEISRGSLERGIRSTYVLKCIVMFSEDIYSGWLDEVKIHTTKVKLA